MFYWTGQNYRGEPNPMVWPATGSQFGILDYCCCPKDEAFSGKPWSSSVRLKARQDRSESRQATRLPR
uniref:hypothetical protein n=1 Tax=Candidatus Cryptobacteroides bacterium TaxID=3085639 RepID=UPI0040261002